MNPGLFEQHLRDPRRRGPVPPASFVGSAGGAACSDLVRIAVRAEDGRIREASFDADGCGAVIAAGSACMELVEGVPLLEAASVGSADIAAALGGLTAAKLHGADLAADALHRALSRLCSDGDSALVEPSSERVVVGLSGGVDSAVAALLEREAGREVVAVTLKLWADPAQDGSRSCCSPEAVVQARALAHSLGLPHLTLDLQDGFHRNVVNDYVGEHERGRTPNPCVRCNGRVRFDAMLALADRIGATVLVTGHYAHVEDDGEGLLLSRAGDAHKDQTYMLSALSPELLRRVRFPLARLTKPQVRDVARSRGLPVAEKRESQDLCFLAGTSRAAFLARHGRRPDRPGPIVDGEGRVLGRHRGHSHYTVGQRRGLGVAAPMPRYVLSKDAATNTVVVGARAQLAVDQVSLSAATLYRDGERVDRVKLRYRSDPVPCSLRGPLRPGPHPTLQVHLHEPVHGVAPGQTACLLDGERVIGYGTIDS